MCAETLEVGGIVLFVDDEPGLSSLARTFASFPAVRSLIATDGRAALQILRRFPVDVLIADQRISGTPGNDLLCHCRRLYPAVVRVLLAACADRQTVSAAAADCGAELVFAKPWQEASLREGILGALAKAGRLRRAARLQAWAGEATSRFSDAAQLLAQLEARDPRTALHSWRVAEATRLFDEELGLSTADLYAAALLHDSGPSSPAQPAADAERGERDELLELVDARAEGLHPLEAERLVFRLPGGPRIASWIRHHHERFDGCGIPDGLRGSCIPLGARALRVADAYDEMIGAGGKEAVCLQSLMQRAGTEFDPRIAKLFVLRALQLAAAGKPPV